MSADVSTVQVQSAQKCLVGQAVLLGSIIGDTNGESRDTMLKQRCPDVITCDHRRRHEGHFFQHCVMAFTVLVAYYASQALLGDASLVGIPHCVGFQIFVVLNFALLGFVSPLIDWSSSLLCLAWQ